MHNLDPFKYDLFPRDDEDAEEDEDYFEMEVPKLSDEVRLPKMEQENVSRPVNSWNPDQVQQIGRFFFSTTRSGSIILR